MTGVSCSFLHARSKRAWWEGRDIQCREEQRGPNCGFLVSWAVRGNHPSRFRRQPCLDAAQDILRTLWMMTQPLYIMPGSLVSKDPLTLEEIKQAS